MIELRRVDRAQALVEIPDSPATIEFRGIALDPRGVVFRSGSGLLLVDAHLPMIGAMGGIDAGDFDRLFRSQEIAREILADRPAHDVLRERHSFERATIVTLAAPWRRPVIRVPGLVVRLLAPDDSIAHAPAEVREEIEIQRARLPVHAGFVNGTAVSFGYVCATERLADISIDTLAEHRRRGIAQAVVSTVIDDCIAEGKTPVWGAVESNRASLGLAAKLGFTEYTGELFVADRPRD